MRITNAGLSTLSYCDQELQIGEVAMESYITVVRRMSMIDLYDSYRNEMVETQEGVEVVKPTPDGGQKAEMDKAGINTYDLSQGLSSSSVNFTAM